MTWGNRYWTVYLLVALFGLMIPEIYALFTNVQNTLSYWVWGKLGVPSHWANAVWFLTLGAWLTVTTWLTFHFWLYRFR